jgi:hypothetical protein
MLAGRHCRIPGSPEEGGHGMRNGMRALRWVVYVAIFVSAAWVSFMGYRQVQLVRSEHMKNRSTWLPKHEIVRLIRYHGTDALKITQDEVYIYRAERWIPVRKRSRG